MFKLEQGLNPSFTAITVGSTDLVTDPVNHRVNVGGSLSVTANNFLHLNGPGSTQKIYYRTIGTQIGTDIYGDGNLSVTFGNSGAAWGTFAGGGTAIPANANIFGGNVGIGTASPKSPLHVVGLPVYANNAAAITGGLTAGALYRTGADPDPVMVVH